MKISHQEYNDVIVVDLHGEFVEDDCKGFQDEMTNLVRRNPSGIVIDMSNVGFVDSCGLEQLLWLKDYCHDSRSQLKLAGMDANISQILELTRIDSQFDKYEQLSEAVKSFT